MLHAERGIEHDEQIQESVFFSTANLLDLEVDLIYLDTTSTYFEVKPDAGDEEELRRLGHSKDHRPDLLQVVIGLTVTRDGIPIRCWIWPANTNDMEVVAQVKNEMCGWKLGPLEAERDRRNRERTLDILKERHRNLKCTEEEHHSKDVCELMASRRFGKYLALDAKGVPRIQQAKVNEEARMDGKYLIKTSDDTLSAEDVVLGYKQLLEVEAAFRTLKSSLDLRPMYHRVSDRIRAHVLICWLALLLVRIAEIKVGESWAKIRSQLERIPIVEIGTPDGRIVQYTDISAAQKAVLTRLEVSEPKRVHEISLKTRPGE